MSRKLFFPVFFVFFILSCQTTKKFDQSNLDLLKDSSEFDQSVKIVREQKEVVKQEEPESCPSIEDEKKVEIKPKAKLKVKKAKLAKTSPTLLAKPLSMVSKNVIKNSGALKLKENKDSKGQIKKEEISKVDSVPSPTPTPITTLARRLPEIEDEEGFSGRRPNVDPFQVGEVITHNVHYFKVSAGELKLKTEPFSFVNGKKSYTLATEIKTSSVFNSFYSVDDRAETLLDFETLAPSVYQLHVKESGQMRESKAVFDFVSNRAKFWEKKVTQKNGLEEKKQDWEIEPFSQNVFSAIHYMRFFKWRVGKEYAFHVAHDEENLVFKGKALRKERLETEVGTFDAVVVKPEFTLRGAFKPVGDIFIWLSDDERRYVLRIECKIKIGTLISEVIKIEPGKSTP